VGKYWTESYSWDSKNEECDHRSRQSPFGFVELEIGKGPVLHRINPAVQIVNLEIDATDLSLPKVRERLRQTLDNINKRSDRDRLVVLPSVMGSCSFPATLLEDICKAYETLNVQKLRDRTGRVSPFAPKVAVKCPILTVDQLREEILKNYPQMVKALSKAGFEITTTNLREICKALIESPYVLQKSSGPVHQHISNILETVTEELENKKAIRDMPPEFIPFLAEQCREAL